jgi:hypothetical protein
MPQPAPAKAAVIVSPASGQQFTTSPVQVSGTCPPQTIVEVYKDNIFAGSSPCTNSGSFAFDIDLLIGQNTLIAKVYDALNQTGPDSNSVNVSYNVLPAQAAPLSTLSLGGAQLLLSTDGIYRGTFPGEQLNVPVSISGGTPPYAINTDWGDSTNTVLPRSNDTTFNIDHVYQKPGTYQIILQASDSEGLDAYLTVVAVVNGQTSAAVSSSLSNTSKNELLVLWPLYTTAATTVISFWLGERREKRIIGNHPLTLHLAR